MACACAHRSHLVEGSATALLLVSYTHRCSGQRCTAPLLLRFRRPCDQPQSTPRAWGRAMRLGRILTILTLCAGGALGTGVTAQEPTFLSLKEVPVPVPMAAATQVNPTAPADSNPIPGPDHTLPFQNLRAAGIVKDQAALLRLGKALFWDMQVGSDGVQACATCHFNAGADTRS